MTLVQNNNYICRLCNYKTNLKANYQLHSKTDKHLQKLNFINHLREGGPRNDHKLRYYYQQQLQQHQQQQKQQQQQQQQQGSTAGALSQQQQQQLQATVPPPPPPPTPHLGLNIVQIKCNCCDFYTNSIQKLSLHTQHMRHDMMLMVFKHLNYLIRQPQQQTSTADGNLCRSDGNTSNSGTASAINERDNLTATSSIAEMEHFNCNPNIVDYNAVGVKSDGTMKPSRMLLCQLCNYTATSLLEMLQHVKSLRHSQVEQLVCLQRRGEQLGKHNLDDIFKLIYDERTLTGSQLALSPSSSLATAATTSTATAAATTLTTAMTLSATTTTATLTIATTTTTTTINSAAANLTTTPTDIKFNSQQQQQQQQLSSGLHNADNVFIACDKKTEEGKFLFYHNSKKSN